MNRCGMGRRQKYPLTPSSVSCHAVVISTAGADGLVAIEGIGLVRDDE